MKALAAVRTRKVFVDASPWHNGSVSNAAFPLSHKGKLRMGKAWNWCVHTVADADRQYRILVAFDPTKNQYWAWLGAAFGHDQALIARVELHSSHDGWHCHWKTGPIAEVPRGAVKASGKKELRRGCGEHQLTVTKNNACGLAYQLFNVDPPSGALGI
jgi:hypothetical protein